MALFIFTACGEPEVTTKIRVGYLQGPTGMGMAKLIHDNGGAEAGNEKYSFKKYTAPSAALKDLTDGVVDVICAPTENAAKYFNTDNWITSLAINSLGSIFVATNSNVEINSFKDLEGKTVYTCRDGASYSVLKYLVEAYGLKNVTISTSIDKKELIEPKDLGKPIQDGSVDIVVVPEPILSNASSANNNPHGYTADLKLNDIWNEKCQTPLTMGCVLSTTSFVQKNESSVNAFLKEYKSSIEFINNPDNFETAANYIYKAGISTSLNTAKSALKNLSGAIAFIEGKDMKTSLEAFYKVIEIPAPSKNSFYYEK